ncbi:tripartite tricarboxylate transporter substrate binding protein [Falsiroseomonas tokyonensis]|uniref:Tripartite tricarboxylate transporter substrate binding protein n=1 Tax=Falsiroseomonas tokyonensis TaxID=430521 RepID=A0ABV7C1Q9_9PROT|nr:tripartite tricarboxylate transporter substrate binding protein [Falsiroseomonas tokyonensis]MBU8540391.1 tripartite tricarboxylate transporter substrate binding protein [Falsiroseomonas tokyonensis]
MTESLATRATSSLSRRALLLGAAGALCAPAVARSQVLSRRPVTLVLPFTPGAPPDVVARVLAEGMQRRLGNAVVVENRPGASGNIGADLVARAAPDGHTLLVHTTTLVMNASLYRTLTYDPLTSFAPLTALVDVDYALVLHPSGGASFEDFLARARSQPGVLNYASPGIGTPHHLTMELFKRAAGVDVTHVPYRGTGPAVTDLLAGQVAAMFMPVNAALELGRGGLVRSVAVASPERLRLMPEVATVAELGVPGVTIKDWFALLAPARTPAPVLELHTETARAVLATPEVTQALTAQGFNVLGGSSAALGATMAADLERWAGVIREAHISAE